eukprot:1045176-Pelagomonas_calceolata.AAC.13
MAADIAAAAAAAVFRGIFQARLLPQLLPQLPPPELHQAQPYQRVRHCTCSTLLATWSLDFSV